MSVTRGGPVPKRSAERRRRNKTPGETASSITIVGKVSVPACPKTAHPIAKRWYNSLRISGQSHWYEPSDWAAALYVVDVMSKNLDTLTPYLNKDGELVAPRFSAELFRQVWVAMGDLMTTETARRRARMEITRIVPGEGEDKTPTALADYRKQLDAEPPASPPTETAE